MLDVTVLVEGLLECQFSLCAFRPNALGVIDDPAIQAGIRQQFNKVEQCVIGDPASAYREWLQLCDERCWELRLVFSKNDVDKERTVLDVVDLLRDCSAQLLLFYDFSSVHIEVFSKGWMLGFSVASLSSIETIKQHLQSLLKGVSVDYFLSNPMQYVRPRMIAFDMDSTLIQEESIELLADKLGKRDEVALSTESAMRGERDFRESFLERVALLEGANQSIFDDVQREIHVRQGAALLLEVLRKHDVLTVILSGGFFSIAEYVQKYLNIDFMRANVLEVQDDVVTGKVVGDVLDGDAKKDHLLELAKQQNIDPRHTVAVGDGANDIGMLEQSGLGVGFQPKSALENASQQVIRYGDLDVLLFLLEPGLSYVLNTKDIELSE